MEFPVVHEQKVEGLVVQVRYEQEYSEHTNPRQWDNLGTMICWHPSYELGDEQFTEEDGYKSMEHLRRYLGIFRGAVVALPLYLLDHSGISIRAGAPAIGDTAIPGGERDNHGNARMWDTTMVGYVYTTRERIAELCGARDYKPDDWKGDQLAWIAKQLDEEVQTYNSFLTGDVYAYLVMDEDGEVLDSCCGFVGEDEDALSEGVESAKREAADRRQRAETEHVEAQRAARMDIATVSA